MKQETINIAHFVKDFETNGYPVDPNSPGFHERFSEHPEQKAIDFYALLVPISKVTVEIAQTDRVNYPPYGLQERVGFSKDSQQFLYRGVTSFPTTDPFTTLRNSMELTLKRTIPNNPHMSTLNNETYSQEAFDALAVMRNKKNIDTHEAPGGGIETATLTMSNTLRLIPELFALDRPGIEPTASILAAVAKKNYPFVRTFTALHLEQLYNVEEKLVKPTGTFLSSDFYLDGEDSIKPTSDTETIIFSTDDLPGVDVWGDRGIIKCPAVHSKAVKSLWDWHVELAEPIYESYLDGVSARR